MAYVTSDTLSEEVLELASSKIDELTSIEYKPRVDNLLHSKGFSRKTAVTMRTT